MLYVIIMLSIYYITCIIGDLESDFHPKSECVRCKPLRMRRADTETINDYYIRQDKSIQNIDAKWESKIRQNIQYT
jgi:hypothetical protein